MNVKRRVAALLAVIFIATCASTFTWLVTKNSKESTSVAPIARCVQGLLKVAIEDGGGIRNPVGYTFVVINGGNTQCELKGYPTLGLSNNNGNTFKITYAHQPTALFGAPTPSLVVLKPGGVASFGISYRQVVTQPQNPTSSCAAQLIDLTLPARAPGFFSFEFPVKIDVCSARWRVNVTPIEKRISPRT